MHNTNVVAPMDFGKLMCMDYFNMQPSEVKGTANIATDFHKRYLLQKIYSKYDFTLPDDWSLGFFRLFLFLFGSIGVIYSKDGGWICGPYGVTKIGQYYRPAVIESHNQFLNRTLTGLIGVNAEIIHILDDRYGLDDLLTRYAAQLADIDKCISVNTMISSTGYTYAAKNKKSGDTIKEAWAKATTGVPLVIVDEKNYSMDKRGLELFNPDLKKNFLVQDLLIARRTIINNFLTDIGINSCNYDKRERLSTEEVIRNDEETDSLAHVILRNIRDGFDRLNRISGLGLSVKLREEASNAETDTLRDAKLG